MRPAAWKGDALFWEGGFNVDADGAPNAYGPHNSGLDLTANAGQPGKWYGVVTDEHGEPVVQGPADPFPGFYVSPTALCDPTKGRRDPARYVDSTKVRYLSVPSDAIHQGIRVGDLGVAYNVATHKLCTAIVADVGPKGKWGEGSIALAQELGLDSSPRHGGTSHGIVVVVFKGSSKGWPRDEADIAASAFALLEQHGGMESFL